MYSSPLHSINKQFPSYLLVSFVLHLFILMWLGKLLPAPMPQETRVVLEIAPEPNISAKPKPKPIKAKPESAPKEVVSRPSPKPIPKEEVFPAQPRIEENERFSMFEENLKGKKAPAQTPFAKKKAQVKAIGAKRPAPVKPPETKTTKNIPPPAPKIIPKEDTAPKQKEFAIRTEELFAKRDKPVETPAKSQATDFGSLLSNLDRHLEVEKYGNIGYAGEGILSFADSDFESVWYGRIVKKKVVDGWFSPYAARVLGLTGRTVITFRIQRDGKLTDIKMEESSGNESLDKAALFAIENAGPLPGLPSDYNYDTLGVIFSFWYNLRPPSQG